MRGRLLKLAAFAAIAYLGLVVFLFLAQRSFVFPAPRSSLPPPAGYTRVALRTEDGLMLKAAWRPAAAGKPTVLFFHGNGDSWAGAAVVTAQLAKAGYGVLLPEYRGYAGSPGDPSEAGFYRDGRAALDWLNKQGVAPSQLVIMGNSIGSGVAVQLATETPAAALVLVSPFENLPDVAAGQFRWLPARWLVRDRFDNLAKIGRVAAPILILHGTADRLIPYRNAEGLARAARHAKLLLFRRAGHELGYRDAAGAAEVAWLDRLFAQPRSGSAPSAFSPSPPP